MSKIVSVILAAALSSQAFAECKPVTPIQAGQVAECPGFIFSPAKELELRQMNEDYKFSQEQIKLYLQQKELYKQQLEASEQVADKEAKKAELWRKAAEDNSAKLIKQEEARTTRDWIFLISGVALTVAAGYAVGQAAK